MAKIIGVAQKIFGGSLAASPNICQIGSTAGGTPNYTTDLTVIQSLAAFLGGFKSQIVNNNSPQLQELNALLFLLTSQIAATQQDGIWQWRSDINYFAGTSFCQVSGKVYVSLQDNNLNHAVTDAAWWAPYTTALPGFVQPYAGLSAPAGWLACDGSSLVRASYPALFTAIGTTWGFADGTHFNVPNISGRTLVGLGTSTATGATAWTAGRKSGEETHQLTAAELPVVNGPQGSNADNGDVGPYVDTAPDQANGTYPATFGANTPHNNLQPSLGMLYIIKT